MICPDKIMECWESCNEVQLADAKNYYTKAQVDEKIDEIEVSGITEEKAQEMIDESLESYYTKTEVDGFVSDLETADSVISGMVNNLSTMLEREAQRAISAETQIDENISNLSGNVADLGEAIETIEGELAVDVASKEWVSGFTYDKQTIEDMIEEGGGFLPENYYDKDATDALLAKKANTATTYTKTNVNTLLEKKADTATTYTKDEINAFMETLEADDSVISGAVVNVSGDVATEVQRAISAETAISGAIPSVEGYFDGVEYNSNTKRINFKHGNTVKTYIDATDFIKDGMVSNVEIVENNLVITFNSDAGHETITIPLTDIFNPNNYYTKTEVDSAVSGKADTSAVTEAISAAVSGKADSSTVTSLNNVVTTHTANTSVHVTAAEKETWNNKSDFSGDYNDLTNKPTIPSYTAGSGITISNDTISAKIWSGTKAAYDALTTKDSDTIYLIYNE